jgi:predicted RecB family nuclease
LLSLPAHFRAEQRQLEQAGLRDWPALAAQNDMALRRLARAGASEQRLIRLRAQARLISEVGLQPQEAALLLHAGIASTTGLAEASPQQLLRHLGRLQRSLTGSALPMPDAAAVRAWIAAARRAAGRPPN